MVLFCYNTLERAISCNNPDRAGLSQAWHGESVSIHNHETKDVVGKQCLHKNFM